MWRYWWLLLSLLALFASSSGAQVVREGYDTLGTSCNPSETTLTRSSVGSGSFGKIASTPVDGAIPTQPLYWPGSPNLVIFGTMAGTEYAVNADAPATIIWTKDLRNGSGVISSPTTNITDTIGELSTPAIDVATSTLLAVTNTSAGYYLHALNPATGAEKFGGPVLITATGFDNTIQMQRPALWVAGGNVIVSFGSYGDQNNYHGWTMAYAVAQGLAQVAVRNWTPTGSEGAIWMAGRAPIQTSDGKLIMASANGTFDGSGNWGMALMKFDPTNLNVLDSWTPTDYAADNASDLDLGGSGPVGLTGTNLVVIGGKQRQLVLVDSTNMGGLGAPLQSFNLGHSVLSGMTYCENTLWVWPGQGNLTSLSFNGTNLNAPVVSSLAAPTNTYFGGALAATPGIVWSAMPSISGGFDRGNVPGIIRAINTDTLTEIWDSEVNSARDSLGLLSKFRQPLIVGGKLYAGTVTDTANGKTAALVTYGLITGQSSGAAAAYIGQDTSTHGTWIGAYGSDGYDIATYSASLPTYASVNVNAANGTYVWAASTSDSRALQIPPTGTSRSATTWYSGGTSTTTIDINLTDGASHQVSLYMLDWDALNRSQTVVVKDATNGTILDTHTVTNFGAGDYVSYTMSGHVSVVISSNTSANNVVSGIFFGGSSTSGGSGGSGSASVTVSWPAWSGATSYVITRSASAAGPFTQVGTSTTNSYSDTTVQHNTSYYYQVVPVYAVQ